MIYLAMSIFQLAYIVLVWPMDSNKGNLMEVFNEATILIVGYHLFVYTDFVENADIKWNTGWSIVGVTLFNILVNLAVAIYDLLCQIGDYLAENCSKKKYKKQKKN